MPHTGLWLVTNDKGKLGNNKVKTITKGRSNARLANQLKLLGFSRGIASWDKSTFTKVIHTSDHTWVKVIAEISNDAVWGNDWNIRKVSLGTQAFDFNFKKVDRAVGTDNTSIDVLIDTLTAVRGL